MKKIKKIKPKSLSELVLLASRLNLPVGAFDGDIEDEAENEAQLIAENVKSESLIEQLRFLHAHGFQLNRLQEMIEQYSQEK